MRILALVPDGFGGHGGIALYGRSVLRAACEHPSRPTVTAIPRVVPLPLEPMPNNLDFHDEVRGSKPRFVAAALRATRERPDLVLCGHLNLLPLASAVAAMGRVPLVLFTYGMEAWRPHKNPAVRALLPTVDAIVAIRRYTARRLVAWAQLDEVPVHLLENPVDLSLFGVRPPNPALVERYGLAGRRVLLTLARVENENYGFDEIIDTLPALVRDMPDLAYVVAGRGDHVGRLREKARMLGVESHVVFTGFVERDEKADHYRLADAFAMPGSDPLHFDRYPLRFVFLEALACGLPVVLSAPEDADEIPGDLPLFPVDPADRASLEAGLRAALRRGRSHVPEGLDRYDYPRFAQRLHTILDGVLAGPRRRSRLWSLPGLKRAFVNSTLHH